MPKTLISTIECQHPVPAVNGTAIRKKHKKSIPDDLAIFDMHQPRWEPDRVAQALAKLLQEPQEQIYRLNVSILERLIDESSYCHWPADVVEICMRAYCQWLTPEALYGEAFCKQLYTNIAEKAVRARILDQRMETISKMMGTEGRGVFIQLSASGAEIAELVSSLVVRQTSGELGLGSPIIGAYYRCLSSIVNLGKEEDDPDERLMSVSQYMAQLARVAWPGIRGPQELALPFKIDKKGKISIFPSVPQVGGDIAPFAGYIKQQWLSDLAHSGKEESVFPSQLGILYTGDGAVRQLMAIQPDLAVAFDQQEAIALKDALVGNPLIIVVLDNGLQIGAKLKENYPGDLENLGKSSNIPGYGVDLCDYQAGILATRFATIRAAYGKATILRFTTARLGAHSTAHGNYQVGNWIEDIMSQSTYPLSQVGFTKQLALAGSKTHLLSVKSGLEQLLVDFPDIPSQLRATIRSYIERIVDPVETVLEEWCQQKVFSRADWLGWKDEATREFQDQQQQIETQARPSKGHRSLQPFLLPFRRNLYHQQNLPNTVHLTTVQAIQLAVQEALLDPQASLVEITGVDAHKGKKVMIESHTGEPMIVDDGDYWSALANLQLQPHQRWSNSPIDEYTTAAFLLGRTLTSTDQLSLSNSIQILADFEYVEYFLNAFGPLRYLGDRLQSTNGKLTSRLVCINSAGSSYGGGSGHAHEDSGALLQLPESMHLVYVSCAQDAYQVLSWILRGGYDHPVIFLWARAAAFVKQTFSTSLPEATKLGRGRSYVGANVKQNKLQLIAFGQSMCHLRQLFAKKRPELQGVNWFDPRTLRPFPWQDLKHYLSLGKENRAPIVIFQEDPLGKGAGDYILNTITNWGYFRDVVAGRIVRIVAPPAIDAPPCDGVLQADWLPDIAQFFDLWIAQDELGLETYYQKPYRNLEALL